MRPAVPAPMRATALLAVLGLLATAACDDARADDAAAGGTIRGTVTFKGAPPTRATLDRTSDPKCSQDATLAEDVVVTDGKLRDVLVRIKKGPKKYMERLDAAPPSTPVVITQTDCAYVPRVVGAVAGQKLEIRNGDPTFHNVRANRGDEVAFNLAQVAKAKPIVRDDLGAPGDVVSLHCDVHPWMAAWVVVTANAQFAVTGADGGFELRGLLPGDYVLEAWHPTLGLQTTKVTVKKGKKAATAKLAFRAAD